ncbi:MAG: hypothetical protein U0931_14495 [Vulcanimicrobiota bacterium]
MKSNRAFSLPEVVLACSLMSLLMLVLAQTLGFGQMVFRTTSGNTDTTALLRKVSQVLERDSLQTSFKASDVANTPGNEGGAFWCLSNLDSSGQPHYKADGSPFWSRNIIFYLVVPNNHQSLFGRTCPLSLVGPNGHLQDCPHKVMVRMEVDSGTATNYANETTEEGLLTPAAASSYFKKPNGYDVSGLYSVAPGIKEVSVIGQLLLDFEVIKSAGAFNVDLRAVSLKRAERVVNTSGPMYNSPFTMSFTQSIYPQVKN